MLKNIRYEKKIVIIKCIIEKKGRKIETDECILSMASPTIMLLKRLRRSVPPYRYRHTLPNTHRSVG